MSNILNVVSAFWSGLTAPRSCVSRFDCDTGKQSKTKLSEEQLDRMLMESCDASDPISTY